MSDNGSLRRALLGATALAGALSLFATGAANAQDAQIQFDLPAQPLAQALRSYSATADREIMFADALVAGRTSPALKGAYTPESALVALLDGTGLTVSRTTSGVLLVQRASDPQSGSAAGDGAEGTVAALVVTAQKREENIQDVPIAMSAFTQEDLTRSQVATGADLMTQVPNMTFTKTNFSGYSIQIRGIGTQAISVTTDPAVAVAFNNTPFIRNRFFEQEFYDLQRIEVLRGPQGTLYGRNATAGVVNLLSAKPSFHYEAKLAADVANYSSTRLEGMLNLPLVDDKVAVRFAGAWTKRDGFTTNAVTGQRTDGRDLWSTRLSLRIEPTDAVRANLIWEHFQEDDDRLRSGKQLCHRDARTELGGHPIYPDPDALMQPLNQGCLPASLYGPEAFETPNGTSLPYNYGTGNGLTDVYASSTQSRNLRVIETEFKPIYRAKSDLTELQFSFDLGNNLTLSSESGYNSDWIFSAEDYNRFAPTRGTFIDIGSQFVSGLWRDGPYGPEFCDPQLGCSDHMMAADLSTAKSRQFSQEFRLTSDFDGPFNFSLGANFLRYDTKEKYYVFINALTLRSIAGTNNTRGFTWIPNQSTDYECLPRGLELPNFGKVYSPTSCTYIDPSPIGSLNDMGHNYFLSKNPFKLLSYAVFGEADYKITDDLKLTAGLRWTVDRKEAPRIPSWILAGNTAGYSVAGVEKQEWREPSGRLALNWKPKLSFTDETLFYASFAHGYKAGGANPPPTGLVLYCAYCGPRPGDPSGTTTGQLANWATHPRTFKPEFVNALELGSKNTLLDGRLTLNGDAFYYDYTGYQISQIIDRSAVNYNFDAKIWGAELELDWRPLENLRLGFKGGYENTRVADGQKAVDVMDRTAGHEGWVVVRPFPSFPSNCILPLYTFIGADGSLRLGQDSLHNGNIGPCEYAYAEGFDPVTNAPYQPGGQSFDPLAGTPGDPYTGQNTYQGVDYGPAPNHGAGFDKDLSGHELPNAPHFTATVTADYTLPLPLPSDWLMTLHTDLYYQSEAWARIFNTPGYDKLKAFTNVNLAAIFSNEDAGWKVMAYVKNVFNKDNITGAFLNSDDTGLTTNVFLVEPRLYGLRVTKEWNGGPWWTGANPNHTGPYPLTIELGGSVQRQDAPYASLAPSFVSDFPAAINPTANQHRKLDWGDERQVSVTYRPEAANWSVSGGFRYARANTETTKLHQETNAPQVCMVGPPLDFACSPDVYNGFMLKYPKNWSDSSARTQENHTIVDFAVGKDVGLGLGLGLGLRNSSASLGLRYADFASNTHVWMHGIPDWDVPAIWAAFKYSHHDLFDADLTANRRFKGAGPTLSWTASHSLLGSDATGHLGLDWSVTGGALFGKQKVSIGGVEKSQQVGGTYLQLSQYPPLPDWNTTPVNIRRNKSVTVPVVDASLGLSYDVQRVKVSTGYRWERYFNVLDAGYAEHKSYDRTIDGPYFKIAVGFGG